MNLENIGLTRKELAAECNCPFYIIDYLRNLGRLPICRAGKVGTPTLYHITAIDVISSHLSKPEVKNG